jgi:peptidoglycan/LPS O-acetylase OafA/YrhL
LLLDMAAAAALVGVRVLLLLAAAALACLVLVAMLLAQLLEQPVQTAGLLAVHPAQRQHRQISGAAVVAHVHPLELKGRLAGHLF